MNPRGSKDGNESSQPPRSPPVTRTEPEEVHEELNDEEREESSEEDSQSEGEEEIEDDVGSHLTSASGPPSTHNQSESGATASPPFLRYRRCGAPSSGQSGAPLPAPAQSSTRPQDPQTPPRNTSRGTEGDLQAGQISRHLTQASYHKALAEAERNHEENPNGETSAALAAARVAEGSAFDHRSPPPSRITQDPFGLQLPPPPHVPGSSQALPITSGPGYSMPAMAPFVREAAQLAYEQQHGGRESLRTPSPDRPRPPRRTLPPHPAHNQPLGQSSTSQQPGQPSAQPPQDSTRSTKASSRQQSKDDKNQNGGQGT